MKKQYSKKDIYQEVTNRIINLLESHNENGYQKTWFSPTNEIFAKNPASEKVYLGMNQLCLSAEINESGYTQNRWMTLKQGNALGAKVKTGERSSMVIFYTAKYIDADGNNISKAVSSIVEQGGEIPEGTERIPIIKHYNVFNIEQFEDMPEEMFFKGEKIDYSEPIRNQLAEEILEKSGARIRYKKFTETFETRLTRKSPNYYSPETDRITLAERWQFKKSGGFYEDAFHELGHWTGHKDRFNRNLQSTEPKDYALEELTAELFSAFICAQLGFAKNITNNAEYIRSWLKCLKDDKKFVFQAAKQAEKAAKYVLDLAEVGFALKPKEAAKK